MIEAHVRFEAAGKEGRVVVPMRTDDEKAALLRADDLRRALERLGLVSVQIEVRRDPGAS